MPYISKAEMLRRSAKTHLMINGQVYTYTLEEIELWFPVERLLRQNGIHTIGDVAEKTEEELRAIRWMGRKRINELRDALEPFDVKIGELRK